MTGSTSIVISTADVSRFACWSGDCNPLHVDARHAERTFFGAPVAHGILAALRALEAAPARGVAPSGLEVAFRGVIFPGEPYEVTSEGGTTTVSGGGEAKLVLRFDPQAQSKSAVAPPAMAPAGTDSPAPRGLREAPAAPGIDDIEACPGITGRYAVEPPAAYRDSGLSDLQIRALALCSYIVGMEIPGRRSLFTGLRILFHAPQADETTLDYRLSVVRFSRELRILDTALEIFGSDGTCLCTAELRAYVPFSPLETDVGLLASCLGDRPASAPRGVALICGGSRGLGADLVAALALTGWHVYASGRAETHEVRRLHEELAAHDAGFEFLAGDAGDPAWCEEVRTRILDTHGQLDLLVLNACTPPSLANLSSASVTAYLAQNLPLVQSPLAAFLQTLARAGGRVVAMSSSTVVEPLPQLAHYTALKHAVEGIVQAAAVEAPQVTYLLPRPPRLLTRWNDTPTAAPGAIASHRVACALAARLREPARPGEVLVLDEFPELAAPAHGDGPEFHVSLCASFTAEPLDAALNYWIGQAGVTPRIEHAGYGQLMQELLNPGGLLARTRNGINVVALRVRDWLRELARDRAGDPRAAGEHLEQTAAEVIAAVRAHRGHAAEETLLLLCPSTLGHADALDGLIDDIEMRFCTELADVSGLTVLRAADFHAAYAVDPDTLYDPVRDEIGHIPFQDGYFSTLGTIAARRICQRFLPLRKVVVVDCDNTLWRGVVGEDGWDGIRFEAQHLALHAFLRRVSDGGVLVCLCSKNEEADVWEVFDKRADLDLRRDQIVAATINWQTKSENLRTLASRLNVGLDSFVFFDDNPVECAEVRAGCPEVLTLEWPQEERRATALLDHLWDLDAGKSTAEDRRRTELYREEYDRQALMEEAPSFQEFLDSLDIEIEVLPIDEDTLPRASQMTLRTNQFNFTTIRRDEADVRALVESPQHLCRIVRVRDRFGDYGVVGLLIARIAEQALDVDTFLLSCRVLGRGVEHRMASELGRLAAEQGLERVTMHIATTQKNRPARKFLRSISGEEHLDEATDSRLASGFPVAYLTELRFDPDAAQEQEAPEEGDAPAPVPAAGSDWTRSRERQIQRTAFDLGTAEALAAELGGAAAQRRASRRSVERHDVADTVCAAFAAILERSPQEIASVDTLEALGCDSFAIVAITVELLEYYPELPPTLLFEHASVSSIIEGIAGLSQPDRASGARPRRSAAPPEAAVDDVAVVGMSVRCAGARSLDEFWRLLSQGISAVRPVPEDREYFLGRLHDKRRHWAGLIEHVDSFDAEFFGVSPREAQSMDPQQRLFLEVAWQALEDAGLTGAGHREDTGVYVGVMYGDYVSAANRIAARGDSPYRSWEGFSLANRLSQYMGYRGPSLAIDTACSSSATALHHACRALRSGECEAAVVGGLNLILDPDRFVQLGRLGILSPTGECRPFAAGANGTNLGEGVGVVVLKGLEAARRDGDRIYGLIKGSGVSTGAGTVGFTAPNPVAQAEAARHALLASRIDPRTVSYIETHGTGTELGDPIEVRGLALAYEDSATWDATLQLQARTRLGSVKSNIGHLEAGAGVTGLIKVLLQLYHGQLVPSLGFAEENPQIRFEATPFDVQTKLESWERPRAGDGPSLPRRAGLNSFGVGGSNAHFVLEEAPETGAADAAPAQTAPDRSHHLLLVSARNTHSLARQATALRDHLVAHPDLSLADLCFGLATRRRHHEQRLALVARTREEAAASLDGFLRGDTAGGRGGNASPPRVVFLFTGQGSQYAGMGRELYDTQPVYREAFDRCCELFDASLDVPLKDIVFDEEAASRIDQTRYTQPALFSLQFALATLWRSWGVEPVAVAGHSIGEFAALCFAGGLSLEDAVRLVEARGRMMQELPAGGAMVSVRAPEHTVLEALQAQGGSVDIAAINGPGQVVISGEGRAVEALVAGFESRGIDGTRLTVSHAFHSPLMEPMLESFAGIAAQPDYRDAEIAFFSSVDGRQRARVDAAYWCGQIRSAVRFADTLAALDTLGADAYLEIGPHPVLLGMARGIAQAEGRAADRHWLASLRRGSPAWPVMLETAASLHMAGATLDWQAFDAPYARRLPPLPAYAFEHRRYWIEDDGTAAGAPRLPERQTERDDLRYSLEWRPGKPPAAPGPGEAEGTWLVLSLGTFAEALATRLGGVAAASLAAARAGLADAAAVAGVVIASGVEADDGTPADVGPLARVFEDVQGVVAALPTARLWLLSRGGADTDPADTPGPSPEGGALLGAARGIAVECPEQWGGLVDLDPRIPAAAQVDSIAAILQSPQYAEDVTALRGDTLLVPRLRAVGADDVSSLPLLRADATYLVTGGTGAIGCLLAEWLAANGARNLVLASRRGETSPGWSELAGKLEAAGVHASVRVADVSCEAEVRELVAACNTADAPLRGIFHAAGVDERVPLAALDREALQRVFAPKARGGWLLHRASESLPLDYFVCFSSMAALVGSPERAHYAAANAYLDALAAHRRALGLAATSVAWGPWAGGGMATEAALAELARIGNHGLEPQRALRELGRVLNSAPTWAAVMDIDWDRFGPVIEARRPLPLIAELGPDARGDATAATDVDAHGLGALAQDERDAALAGLVRAEVARALGFDDPARIDADGNYFDMGLDSLMVVQLAGELETRLGIEVGAAVYEHPSVSRLAAALSAALPEARESAEPVDDGASEADEIVGYASDLEPAIDAFQREAWPARRNAESLWRWMFLDSAKRLGRPPALWFYTEEAKVVGETGAIPVRLKVGDEEYDAAWLVDSMVLQPYRERAVGTRILHRAMGDQPLALSLGQEAYMREIQLRMGWRSVGRVGHYVYPLRSRRLLRGKIPAGPLAWTAAAVLEGAAQLRRVIPAQAPAWKLEVTSVDRFGAPHDELWARVKADIACCVVRDASYLNWKYVDREGVDFQLLEMRRGPDLVAAAVVALREPDEVYRYRRGFIVDLLLPPSDRALVRGVLAALRAYFLDVGADAIHGFVACSPLEAEMKRFGFIEREADKHLLIATHREGAVDQQLLASIDSWMCLLGDSDMDAAVVAG